MSSTQRGIVAFVLVASLAMGAVAYASSYSSTFSYQRGLLGKVRYYDGQNIRASLTPKSNPIQTSYLRLYRVTYLIDGTAIYRTVAQPTFNSSTTGATVVRSYPGVGKGNYAFEFEKTTWAQKNSGVWVTGNINMYNY